MNDHVIEIKQVRGFHSDGKTLCGSQCHAPKKCKWAKAIDGAYLPGPDCPGPGRYKLVRIDGDDRDGMLGPK